MASRGASTQRLTAGWDALEREDFSASEEIARKELVKDPADVEALHLLGTGLLYQERYREALAPLRAAFEKVSRGGAGYRLGYCYLALGDFRNAESVLQQEIEAYPDRVDARNALGVALVNQSRREEALQVFLEAARLYPSSAEANNNVGNVLSELARYEEAIPFLQKAIEARPDLADTHHNLAMIFQMLKRHEEAIVSLQKALTIAPHMSYTLSHLVWNELAICRWGNLRRHIDELRAEVRDRQVAAAPFPFIVVSPSPVEQRLCAELAVRQKFPALPQPLWQGTRYRHGKIRLAYLSADFAEHALSYLTARMFELHDRSKFEIIGISYGPDDRSPMRKRLIAGFDRFIDVRGEPDASVARMLREFEVDIAIDLVGHTTNARPGILACRPVPIQVGYLGFAGTSGAEFMDYLLADRFVVPEEEQRFYTEKVVYLPDCYFVNDSGRVIPESTPERAAVGLPPNGFVFCCFNNNFKISPQMFDIWMRLLREIPGSVLWLVEDNRQARSSLTQEARARGIAPERLAFAARLPYPDHLARHRLADLFLDTLPYNAHTTATDALWAGLPVLTCAGTTFAGRVAASLLHAIGLPELVTNTLQEYESQAVRLASNAHLLVELKARLAHNRHAAPLFHTDRFTRHMESAYRTMWEIWQGGEEPRAFAVDPSNSSR